MFETEYEFTLPRGYKDPQGELHRDGVMRLATAADEILPLKDPRVQANPAYLVVILLSRVITRLGSLDVINPKGDRRAVRIRLSLHPGLLQSNQRQRHLRN